MSGVAGIAWVLLARHGCQSDGPLGGAPASRQSGRHDGEHRTPQCHGHHVGEVRPVDVPAHAEPLALGDGVLADRELDPGATRVEDLTTAQNAATTTNVHETSKPMYPASDKAMTTIPATAAMLVVHATVLIVGSA